MADQMPSYANYLLPQSATSVIPQQLGNDYLSNLENTLNLQEQQQMKQLLAQENQMGTVSSGDTNFGLASIVGNTQRQFGQAATGLASAATGQAQGQQFNTQFEQQAFQDQLAAMAQQASYQQQLERLQKSLRLGPFYQPTFSESIGSGLGSALPGALFSGGLGALSSML